MTPKPLTREEFLGLPIGTRVTVLWSGGNGPHEYVIGPDGILRTDQEVRLGLPGMNYWSDSIGPHPVTRIWLAPSQESP